MSPNEIVTHYHDAGGWDFVEKLQGRFDLPGAIRIARALEPYNILYLENVMLMNNAKSYAALAAETSVPICMSETLATRYEYREFFELSACDVIMYDLSWCGGISDITLNPSQPNRSGFH